MDSLRLPLLLALTWAAVSAQYVHSAAASAAAPRPSQQVPGMKDDLSTVLLQLVKAVLQHRAGLMYGNAQHQALARSNSLQAAQLKALTTPAPTRATTTITTTRTRPSATTTQRPTPRARATPRTRAAPTTPRPTPRARTTPRPTLRNRTTPTRSRPTPAPTRATPSRSRPTRPTPTPTRAPPQGSRPTQKEHPLQQRFTNSQVPSRNSVGSKQPTATSQAVRDPRLPVSQLPSRVPSQVPRVPISLLGQRPAYGSLGHLLAGKPTMPFAMSMPMGMPSQGYNMAAALRQRDHFNQEMERDGGDGQWDSDQYKQMMLFSRMSGQGVQGVNSNVLRNLYLSDLMGY